MKDTKSKSFASWVKGKEAPASMKCYVRNSKGTIYRVDKFSWLKDKIPSQVDWARRYLLALKLNKKPEPFKLMIPVSEYERTLKAIKEDFTGPFNKNRLSLEIYNSNDDCVLWIYKDIQGN